MKRRGGKVLVAFRRLDEAVCFKGLFVVSCLSRYPSLGTYGEARYETVVAGKIGSMFEI